MKANVYSKELKISKETEERIGDKLAFLDKYLLIDDSTTAQVIAKKHGNDVKLEITIPSKIGYLRSETIDHDMNNAIDKSIAKLESQIRSQKTRLSRRHKEKLAKKFIDETDFAQQPAVEKVAKVKRVVVDDLDSDEAILQMELMDHDFFVYRDSDTHMVSVMYKREDGGYGILEVA